VTDPHSAYMYTNSQTGLCVCRPPLENKKKKKNQTLPGRRHQVQGRCLPNLGTCTGIKRCCREIACRKPDYKVRKSDSGSDAAAGFKNFLHLAKLTKKKQQKNFEQPNGAPPAGKEVHPTSARALDSALPGGRHNQVKTSLPNL
jgi:hypothetical protein